VKRIEVKGFELKNMLGTDGYLYLKDIIVSKNKSSEAVIEFRRMTASGKVVKHTARFNEGAVWHVYFIAETKGTMDTMEPSTVEQTKIACAKKVFNELSGSRVRYHQVSSYDELLEVIQGME